jgi:predicted RNase H-like HicB family nuclease
MDLSEVGMAFYTGLVDRSAGGALGVWFPDLPGATSAGASIDEIYANAMEAIRLWAQDAIADGETVPPPRSMSELLQDEEVKEALKEDSATLVQVPLLLDGGRPTRVNVSLESGLLEAIDAAARERGLTRSAFLASAAREKIARKA